jgi:hypothetical protein
MNTEELFAQWMIAYLTETDTNVLRIRRAAPRFQTRNYFTRFKVETAKLDGTGQNPYDIKCVIVQVSDVDQRAQMDPSTSCDSISDL